MVSRVPGPGSGFHHQGKKGSRCQGTINLCTSSPQQRQFPGPSLPQRSGLFRTFRRNGSTRVECAWCWRGFQDDFKMVLESSFSSPPWDCHDLDLLPCPVPFGFGETSSRQGSEPSPALHVHRADAVECGATLLEHFWNLVCEVHPHHAHQQSLA